MDGSYFDAALRVDTLDDDALENTRYFGTRDALVWTPAPTSGDLESWLSHVAGAAAARARAAGLRVASAVGVGPEATPARSWEPVLGAVETCLARAEVAALGPLTLADDAVAAVEFTRRQLALGAAAGRPALLRARDADAVDRWLAVAAEVQLPPERCLFDGPDAALERALAAGAWALLAVHASRRSAADAAAWCVAQAARGVASVEPGEPGLDRSGAHTVAPRVLAGSMSTSPLPNPTALGRLDAALARLDASPALRAAVLREHALALVGPRDADTRSHHPTPPTTPAAP